MKKDNKKATKNRKKVTVKDLKPKKAGQVRGGRMSADTGTQTEDDIYIGRK